MPQDAVQNVQTVSHCLGHQGPHSPHVSANNCGE